MPWKIEKHGNAYALINMLTGAQKGPTYHNKSKARAYQRALYANDPGAVAEAKKMALKKRNKQHNGSSS